MRAFARKLFRPSAAVAALIAVAFFTNLLPGIAQTVGDVVRNPVIIGHITSVAGPAQIPVLSACGTTPALSAGASDAAGTITLGTTATGCVVTFGAAYTTAPTCFVNWIATPLASQSYVTSTTALTLTQTSTTNNVVKYFCLAIAGG